MTTRDEIREWLNRAKASGASHMLVVCDTFDHSDYPVNVSKDDRVNDMYKAYHEKNMQRVIEVYNLSMDIDEQLAQHRAMNF